MEKRRIIFLVILLSIIVIGIISLKVIDTLKDKEEESSIEICEKYSEDFDTGLKVFMSDEEYNKLTDEEQISLMNDFLKCYESKGLIQDLSYEEEGKIFSFKDKNGYLRGVMMESFDGLNEIG